MDSTTSPELYWTTLTALMTALLWVPHILQRIMEMSPAKALRDPKHDEATKAPWAQRAIRAHMNAVENLVVFGLLAVIVHISGASTELTAKAAAVYFFARAAHYVLYVFAVPWLRTPSFIVGAFCQLIMAATLLGWM